MLVETYTEYHVNWMLGGSGQVTSETINPKEPIVIPDCHFAAAVGFYFSQRTAANYNGEILRGRIKENLAITYIDALVYSLSEIKSNYPNAHIITRMEINPIKYNERQLKWLKACEEEGSIPIMEKKPIEYAVLTRAQAFELLHPGDSVISVGRQRIIYPEVEELPYEICYQQR
jgi:hypothetical protein